MRPVYDFSEIPLRWGALIRMVKLQTKATGDFLPKPPWLVRRSTPRFESINKAPMEECMFSIISEISLFGDSESHQAHPIQTIHPTHSREYQPQPCKSIDKWGEFFTRLNRYRTFKCIKNFHIFRIAADGFAGYGWYFRLSLGGYFRSR